MSASGQATVTAKTGPAIQVTAGVFTNVDFINFDISGQILTFRSNGVLKYFDLGAATTVTTTLVGAAGNWTVTIS